MFRRHKPLTVDDYRAVLKAKGEIRLGGYARHEARRRVLLTLTGLILIGGAAALYFALRPRDGETPHMVPVPIECVACRYRGNIRVAPTTVYPLTCPKCRARSCYKLWQCRDCGHVFLPRAGKPPVCPNCRSTRVGTAEPLPEPAGP